MRFIITFCTVALIAAISSGTEHHQDDGQTRYLSAPDLKREISNGEKWKTNRSWTEKPSRRMWSVGTDESSESFLLNPSQIEVGPKDNLFVLDRGDYSIKMFGKNGSFLRSVAGTRGQGPGELMNPTGFDIDEEGRIWIADPPNGRVHVYGPDGLFSYDIQLDHRPHRVAVFDDGSGFYTAWLSPTNSALFARYDGDGNLQKKIGQVVEGQAKRGMALGGSIAVMSDRSFYFTMTRAGRLLRYNAQGETVFDVKTIDPAPIPEVVIDDHGGRRVDPSASILSLSVQIVKGKIAILAVIENREDVQRAFDIYSVEGKYEYSVPLPKGTSRACLTSDRVYTLTDTSLIAWDYSI